MKTANLRYQLSSASRELLRLSFTITELEIEVGLLAQRKFADGWDAALVNFATKQSSTKEPTFDSAGDIPHDYTRD